MGVTFTCRCHRQNIVVEDESLPADRSVLPESFVRKVVSRGWVCGIPDPVRHPDEVHVYCSPKCLCVDAAETRQFRPSNYRYFIELHGLKHPEENERGKRYIEQMDAERASCGSGIVKLAERKRMEEA